MAESGEHQSSHEESLVSRLESSRESAIFSLGIIVAGLVVLGWSIVMVLGLTRDAQIRELNDSISNLNGQLSQPSNETTYKQYAALDGVATQFSKVRNARALFLPSWQLIKKSVPKDVQFTSVTVGQDGVFRITGITRSVTSVANFSKQLATNPTLSQVAPLSVDKQGGSEIYNFTMTFKAKLTDKGGAS